jgi:hypothetical protein
MVARPLRFEAIIWDLDEDPDGNVQHCADHGVMKEEVEEVLENPVDLISAGLPADPWSLERRGLAGT